MKLPRWLVITMLTASTLAILAFAGWWWVRWPDRTMKEFISLLKRDSEAGAYQGAYDKARQMTKVEGKTSGKTIMVNNSLRAQWIPSSLVPESRATGDLMRGRQAFHITEQPVRYVVQRGIVTECGTSVMSDEAIDDAYRTPREIAPLVRKRLQQ